jgi:hypothetical protein
MKHLLLALVAVCAVCLGGCFKEEWEGFVYPNKNDLTKHIGIGIYKSLEECRASTIGTLNQVSSVERGDYECGLNCKTDNDLGGIKVCEKTER